SEDNYDWSWLDSASVPNPIAPLPLPDAPGASSTIATVPISTPIQEQAPSSSKPVRQDQTAICRTDYPRAYEKWTMEEDDWLIRLVRTGVKREAICTLLQRQPGAITSRIKKLNLQEEGSPS